MAAVTPPLHTPRLLFSMPQHNKTVSWGEGSHTKAEQLTSGEHMPATLLIPVSVYLCVSLSFSPYVLQTTFDICRCTTPSIFDTLAGILTGTCLCVVRCACLRVHLPQSRCANTSTRKKFTVAIAICRHCNCSARSCVSVFVCVLLFQGNEHRCEPAQRPISLDVG